MNLRTHFFIISLSINISCYLFSALSTETSKLVVPTLNPLTSLELRLGAPYALPDLPNQNKTFTPIIPEKGLSNLWGLWPAASTETPREHILRILQSGQMHSACRLASTDLETIDPRFLEQLAIVTGEEFNNLRTTVLDNKAQTTARLEQNRKNIAPIIFNIHLLLAAIKSSVTTQGILTPERKNLLIQAMNEARNQQANLFTTESNEHMVFLAALEKIQEILEPKGKPESKENLESPR